MCRSVAEGGQRCAAHTRAAVEVAEARYATDRSFAHEDALTSALIDYASTPSGENDLRQRLDNLSHTGDARDRHRLEHALSWGRERRQVAAAARRVLEAAKKPDGDPGMPPAAAAFIQRVNAGSPIELEEFGLLPYPGYIDGDACDEAEAAAIASPPRDVPLRLIRFSSQDGADMRAAAILHWVEHPEQIDTAVNTGDARQAPLLLELPDGTYRLADGHHRYAASHLHGLPTLRGHVGAVPPEAITND